MACQTVTICTCAGPFTGRAVLESGENGCNFCGRTTVPGQSICIGAAVPECDRIALAVLADWQHRAELDYIRHQ